MERKQIKTALQQIDVRVRHLISSRALRAALIAAVLVVNDAAPAADYELLSTMIVSRHGMRSPIAGTSSLARIAADPWVCRTCSRARHMAPVAPHRGGATAGGIGLAVRTQSAASYGKRG